MHKLQKRKEIIYEEIAVLAICIPDTGEMPFEITSEAGLEQYRRMVEMCVCFMKKEAQMKQVLIWDHCIWGIFGKDIHGASDEILESAKRIRTELCRVKSSQRMFGNVCLTIGMGLAVGTGVKMWIGNTGVKKRERNDASCKEWWMGAVFDHARSAAYQSACDGQGKIFVASRGEWVYC